MRTRAPLLPLIGPRDHGAETRARLETLTQELASGRQADTGRALSSDFSAVSQAVHALRTHDARAAALSTAGTWLQGAQTSLDAVRAAGARIGEELTAALGPSGAPRIDALAATARGALSDMASALEIRLGGRAIFGNGDASPGPLIDLDRLMSETAALAAGATDLDGLLLAFDTYFAAGGGIETTALKGLPAPPTRFPVGGGSSVEVPVSLSDPAIRDALKQAALVAALPQAGFPIVGTAAVGLSAELPRRTAQIGGDVASTQGRLGAVQERVERRASDLGRIRTEMEARRTDAMGADPFDTATRLQNEMTRLETIYAVTARRARLRLTDYLR